MNLEISIPHGLDEDTAAARLRDVAQKHDVLLNEQPDGRSGTLEKKIPLVGGVQARYLLTSSSLDIVVTKAPSFLSPERVRSLLEGELAPALAGEGDASS